MIQQQLKICSGGCQVPRRIWKNYGGLRFCAECWVKKSRELTKTSTGVKPTNKPQKRIPPRSKKRSIEERIYAGKRFIFLFKNPMCQAKISSDCQLIATECHHKAGRVGKLLCDETKFLAVCHSCHGWIENEREKAIKLGFSELRTNI